MVLKLFQISQCWPLLVFLNLKKCLNIVISNPAFKYFSKLQTNVFNWNRFRINWDFKCSFNKNRKTSWITVTWTQATLSRDEKIHLAAFPIKHLRWFRALRSLVPVFACLETFAPLFPLLHDSCLTSIARGPFKAAWISLLSAFFCVAFFASENSKARQVPSFSQSELCEVICS